ncbi:hypothetical protein P755_gp071 [Mycobacterium phage Quink]|uniref:Uncharacterized protein n=8 Tax=Caudoviricetes TaxID=2731619 RepID=Q857U3_9CAUD|nr:gp69 [Mycobacterium phage Cjw1]YP_008052001.1 hypothetical protein PBI_PHRUX_65 [Mycobacterium phage Phrux]YP_008409461.1 hypothetical protein DRDREY_68 [Mycobacterium phage DrDrey]YP_008430582.1 hypothetical protein GOKU_66 [Mycobacterium phage Goku]YP_008531147.1 hypothetical protein P755_gp071 [Mycobacterium phage Quink]YP_009011829.1 hypothetical protein LILAC_70 [Mycobacterium phage Lilac]YP_009224333.1 hypothetical protein SEA_DUSK_65 [Mycobacterium phage Dusk]YP_009591606.1 hypothe
MTTEIGQKIITKIREIAAEKPDFVYQPPVNDYADHCVYVHGGQPSCIVGQALWKLGIIGPSLEVDRTRIDDTEPGSGRGLESSPNRAGSRGLLRYLGLEVSPEEDDWIRAVQQNQDCEHSWADSVKWADSTGDEDA